MQLFLHVCCAHCLDRMLFALLSVHGPDLSVHGYFYNPNIHPLIEFRKRLKSVKVLNERMKLPFFFEEEYGLDFFLQQCWKNGENARCLRCYHQRFQRTAGQAKKLGYTVFSSTLCVSDQQNHEELISAGTAAAEDAGISFYYRDLRESSVQAPRRNGLYNQMYCGCIFSEEERYRHTRQDLYRGVEGEFM